MPQGTEPSSSGFPPIEGEGARIMVLGSLPGVASIEAAEYYAHPRNAFWRIMAELVGATGSYTERCSRLIDCGVLVWDVLAESVRPGSLDSAIRMDTAVVNDFDTLFARQPGLSLVAFNGRKAEDMFTRRVTLPARIQAVCLPSTSPANASLRFEQKLEQWRTMVGPYLAESGP